MAIRTLITRGFGNGTFSGSTYLLPTRGYGIAALVALDSSKYQNLFVLDLAYNVCILDSNKSLLIPDIDSEIEI